MRQELTFVVFFGCQPVTLQIKNAADEKLSDALSKQQKGNTFKCSAEQRQRSTARHGNKRRGDHQPDHGADVGDNGIKDLIVGLVFLRHIDKRHVRPCEIQPGAEQMLCHADGQHQPDMVSGRDKRIEERRRAVQHGGHANGIKIAVSANKPTPARRKEDQKNCIRGINEIDERVRRPNILQQIIVDCR